MIQVYEVSSSNLVNARKDSIYLTKTWTMASQYPTNCKDNSQAM